MKGRLRHFTSSLDMPCWIFDIRFCALDAAHPVALRCALVERVYPGHETAQRHVPYRSLRVRVDVIPLQQYCSAGLPPKPQGRTNLFGTLCTHRARSTKTAPQQPDKFGSTPETERVYPGLAGSCQLAGSCKKSSQPAHSARETDKL